MVKRTRSKPGKSKSASYRQNSYRADARAKARAEQKKKLQRQLQQRLAERRAKPSRRNEIDTRGTRIDRNAADQSRKTKYLRKNIEKKTAARSARSKTASSRTPTQTQVLEGSGRRISKRDLAVINKSRSETRNSWSRDRCVERPDSKVAGKARASGKGGNYEPRRWC